MSTAKSPSTDVFDAADGLEEGSSLVNAPSADWFVDLPSDESPCVARAHHYEDLSNMIGENLNALVAGREALIRLHCPE